MCTKLSFIYINSDIYHTKFVYPFSCKNIAVNIEINFHIYGMKQTHVFHYGVKNKVTE